MALHPSVLILFFLSLLLMTVPSSAQTGDTRWSWNQCAAPLDIPPSPDIDEELLPGEIYLSADEADITEGGMAIMEGNVEIVRDEMITTADKLSYDQEKETGSLENNVQYWDNEYYVRSNSAFVDKQNRTGRFTDADYAVRDTRGRGHADEMFHEMDEVTIGTNIDYTSCDPEQPGADMTTNVWKIQATEMILNHELGRGRAKNVVLRVKDVPVFYTPYMSFPLNDNRKTGFLTPSIGYSSHNGLEVQIPFYWNFSPNIDATLTPRSLTDSGLMGIGEFRYLFKHGAGKFNIEYLPSDGDFNKEDRSFINFEHLSTFADRGQASVLFNNVSDTRYYQDFGETIAATSTLYVERNAKVSYIGDFWNAAARVQDFQIAEQTLSSTQYTRLPQINVNAYTHTLNRRINLNLQSEFTYFDISDTTQIEGNRIDITPSVSYPFETASGYMTPKAGVRYTQYNLERTPLGMDDSPDRLTPFFSLDAGMYFEKDVSLLNDSLTHTLEPRLYYLYVGDEDQSDIPIFDTSLYDFNYYSMFTENRYVGADRIGDANQITLALTSRLINDSGEEMGQLSMGQIIHMEDRDIQLPGQIRQTDTLSPFVALASVNLSSTVTVRGEIQWDPNINTTRKIVASTQFRPSAQKVLNIAYRIRRNDVGSSIVNPVLDVKQTDISFRWPLNGQWSAIGRWNYAIEQNKSLDLFAGVEYDSCCWSMRFVGRRFISGIQNNPAAINLEDDYQTGIFMQVELKGLAGLGRKTVDFLSENIPGYTSAF